MLRERKKEYMSQHKKKKEMKIVLIKSFRYNEVAWQFDYC